MKVLFQKPGWATATFGVSARARSAVTVAMKPMSRANVLFMTCPTFIGASENDPLRGAHCSHTSILLDVLLAHHATPTREFIAHEFAEFRARHRRGRCAGLKELLADVGRIEHGDDRVVQFRHPSGRRL